jgi:hypothetical protein
MTNLQLAIEFGILSKAYNDHPLDPKIVAVVDRWSLFRSHLCYKTFNRNLRIMILIDRWSLTQV